MRPFTLRLPAARLFVALVITALGVLAAPSAMASTSVGVCHKTPAGHYTWERVSATSAAAHSGHAGDLVGPDVTAADCPGATITPKPVRYDRSTSMRTSSVFASWYVDVKQAFRTSWHAGR